MILALTNRHDDHSDIVLAALQQRGAQFCRFNTEDFCSKNGTNMSFSNLGQNLYLNIEGTRIDLASIDTVWYRRPESPTTPTHIQEEDRAFAQEESKHVLRALWQLLADRFWVNSYDKTQIASLKPYQLQVARQSGLRVPKTLITNDPAEVLRFYDECAGNIVYKMLTPHSRKTDAGGFQTVYTTRVQRSDLVSRQEGIRIAPCTFQEYVSKEVELRVTVIGNTIHSAAIDSQKGKRTRDDWRRYDFSRCLYAPTQLPTELEKKIFAFMAQLGLVFGCLDLILTPDGEYVFLEINPNGQWYWVEVLTELPLLNTFAEFLVSGKNSIQGEGNRADLVFQNSDS